MSFTAISNQIRAFKYEGNGDGTGKYIQREYPNILVCLREECRIQEGTTLKDIFTVVENTPFLKELISQYSWCQHINEFHADAEKEATPLDIDHLEIRWSVTNLGGHLDFFPDFHGVGIEDGKEVGVCVSYCRMGEIAHLPIKLSPTFTVYGEDFKPLIQFERSFTLLEVLDAIYHEISFHGSPDATEEWAQQLIEDARNAASPLKLKHGKIQPITKLSQQPKNGKRPTQS